MTYRILGAVLPLALVAALSALVTPAHAGPAAPEVSSATYAYQGDAYGTQVNVDGTVTSGRSAPVVVGCTTTPGISHTNTVASVNASPVLTAGEVNTTAQTFAGPTRSRTSATVKDVNLLDGVITAAAVKSVSSTTHDGTVFGTSAAGTTFTTLVVAGDAIPVNVPPNTRIDIPDVGHVILNEQVATVNAGGASLTVNAIHLVVTQGSNAGTDVVVAHARSGLRGPVTATLDGFAYGSFVKLGALSPRARRSPSSCRVSGRVVSSGRTPAPAFRFPVPWSPARSATPPEVRSTHLRPPVR